MPTRYRWHRVITNGYTTKVIRGMTKADVEQKATAQLAAWRHQESQRRARVQAQMARQAQQDELRTLEAEANAANDEAQARVVALKDLLPRALNAGPPVLRWEAMKQHTHYPPFQYQEQPPTYDSVAQRLGVPEPSFLETVLAGKRKKREALEAQAQAELTHEMAQYDERNANELRAYTQQRQAWERGRDDYNASVDARRQGFEHGDTDAVVWALTRVLDHLALPEEYGSDVDVAFDAPSGIAVVNMQLPTLDEVPRVVGYKFVRARKAIEPIEMKQKDFEALYDSVLHQIALLTIHRLFREADTPALQSVVFNGWVTGVDRKTGNDFFSCILSVQAPRQTYASLHLERVDPKECIRNLKGLVAGPLAQLAPVKPIMDLNREDARFVESREVLAGLNASDNLATMDWVDFEHLVRELFAKVFGGEGAEVRVTQASRDRGVDAIAFDPDPIRGGKFVIQAKRYNNVVPVSAVRDLYGTMINEGAVKGLLVTTSYFGNDSREFAKDKPLTLIDGANLVQMFQQYGYGVTIELQY